MARCISFLSSWDHVFSSKEEREVRSDILFCLSWSRVFSDTEELHE